MLCLTEQDNNIREMYLSIQNFTNRIRNSKSLSRIQKDKLWRMAKVDLEAAEKEFHDITSGYRME